MRERAEAAKEERRAKQDERMHNAQTAREGLMLEKATRARLENLKVEEVAFIVEHSTMGAAGAREQKAAAIEQRQLEAAVTRTLTLTPTRTPTRTRTRTLILALTLTLTLTLALTLTLVSM